MATKAEILEVLSLLEEYYARSDGKPVYSERQLPAYFKGLRDVDTESLTQGAYDLMASKTWPPKISELREAAERVRSLGRSAVIDDDPDGMLERGRLYWQAMDAFGRFLRGQITEHELELDRSWRWYERSRRGHPDGCRCLPCRGLPVPDVDVFGTVELIGIEASA